MYMVFGETVCSTEIGKYETYGIQLVENSKLVVRVHDVSKCRRAVSQMVENFNQGKLSQLHIWDAIEDFFGQF